MVHDVAEDFVALLVNDGPCMLILPHHGVAFIEAVGSVVVGGDNDLASLIVVTPEHPAHAVASTEHGTSTEEVTCIVG